MVKLIGLLAVWCLCLALALAGGWAAMWLLVYLLALLVVGGLAWAHLNVVGLELRRRHRDSRIQVGDPFVEQAILESRPGPSQWWPRLWVEVHDRSTLPGHYLDRVVSLGPLGRRVWELRSTCKQRGRFTLGPVVLTSGDPFGLFRASRKVADSSTVIVYPRIVDLPRFGRLPGELPGGSLQGSRVPFSTPNVSGVREYRPGDPFNHIHWPTTARTERLMVREFELDPSADIWLALDLCRDVQVGEGPESTEEYAVTIAASLGRHFLSQGRSVGLISQPATLPSDRGPGQLDRLLEVLAIVRASSHLTLDALLAAEVSRFVRSSTLVVITASTADAWASFCGALQGRGIHVAAVMLDAATFGKAPTPLIAVGELAAARVPTCLVKQGDSLAEALAEPAAAVLESSS